VVALRTQRPPGSLPPSGTFEQVPMRPCTVQLMQVPFVCVLQALLQQTPSVQKPLMHWLALLHAAPFGARPHVPFVHTFPLEQSALVVHEVLHSPVPAVQA
jgi:hypothetical protein